MTAPDFADGYPGKGAQVGPAWAAMWALLDGGGWVPRDDLIAVGMRAGSILLGTAENLLAQAFRAGVAQHDERRPWRFAVRAVELPSPAERAARMGPRRPGKSRRVPADGPSAREVMPDMLDSGEWLPRSSVITRAVAVTEVHPKSASNILHTLTRAGVLERTGRHPRVMVRRAFLSPSADS